MNDTARRLPKRHPLEVTADRLGDTIHCYGHHLTGRERDMPSALRDKFERLAEDGAQPWREGR